MIGAAIATQAEALFARYLDLAPLRGRRRGLVKCIFHEDRSPSLSVDLDAGIFHCFGCHAGGGGKRFAELVGEAEPAPSRPARPRPLLEEALTRVRREAERQRRRLDRYRDLHIIADHLRSRYQAVAEARRQLTHASLAEIGQGFGGKDHTTVLHAVDKIQAIL